MKAQPFKSASFLGYALALLSSKVIASTITYSTSGSSTTSCFEETIADGDCDLENNTPDCGGYDGGDCCECTCVNSDLFVCGDPNNGGFSCIDPSAACVDDDDVTTNPDSELSPTTSSYSCNAAFIGDGDCDLRNNNENCGYDGGDCCECTCVSTTNYACGDESDGGYSCLDPSASCVDDDDVTTLPSSETIVETFSDTRSTDTITTSTPCIPGFSADGDCDSANNNDECDYDGGDCCECTCVSSNLYTCGDPDNSDFECIDPSASCVDDDDVTTLPEDDSNTDNPDDDARFPDDDSGFLGSFSFSECIEDFISDGNCDSINNTEDCDYDGGDCCECTCVSSEDYTCGAEGLREFDCQDPSVNCDNDYVEAGTKTTITASVNAYDTRPGGDSGDIGCMEDGCEAALARDGDSTDVESRWSCAPSIVTNQEQCMILFVFEEAQDIVDMEVAFWKSDERSRTLEVTINGDVRHHFISNPESAFTALNMNDVGVSTLALTSVGLDETEWLSLLEVNFLVEA